MKTIYPFMGLALCGAAAQAQEKPNFLIIQCDHLTQRVVGAYVSGCEGQAARLLPIGGGQPG